jgi:hypothetical protein
MPVAPVVRALVPVAGAVIVLLMPLHMEGHARSALAIATAMILCWLVEVLHPAIAGFIGCFLFRAAADVDFEGAFAGFGTETPWFVYGALLLVGAANQSGLIRWLTARTPRAFVGSLLMPAIVLVLLAYALAFVVPSSLARATILILPAVAWTPQPSIAPGQWPCLVLAAAYGSAMFGHPDLPGGPLSVVGWDVAASLAVVAAAVCYGTMSAKDHKRPSAADHTALSAVDLKCAAPVLLATVLWLTTSLHGVSPALVGLGCGLLCCVPGIASPDWQKALNADHLAVVFVGTAISIPAVLLETKASEVLVQARSSASAIAGGLPDHLVAYWSTTAYRMFSPEGARPTLPSLDVALGSAAIWSYAGSTLVSLHQSPALILAMALGGCRARHVLTVGLLVIILGSAVVTLF